MMSANAKTPRRGLKRCIRTILHRHLGASDRLDNQRLAETSKFPTKTNTSLTLPPGLASISSLSSFGSDRFKINNHSTDAIVSTPSSTVRVWATDYSRENTQLSITASSDHGGLWDRCRALPSSTQVLGDNYVHNQMESCIENTRLPWAHLARGCSTTAIHRRGASLQPSVDTVSSWTASQKSASTLRLRAPSPRPRTMATCLTFETLATSDGRPTDWSVFQALEQLHASRPISRIGFEKGPPGLTTSSSTPVTGGSSRYIIDPDAGLVTVHHFRSFCVLDSTLEGCPITAMSKDLGNVFELGEEFTLRTRGIKGSDIDMCTGLDTDGNTVIHLVVYRPLVNPKSGRNRFVLACLLDITTFVLIAASVPDLDVASEHSVSDGDVRTPEASAPADRLWHELSAEDLLGGCILADGPHTPELLAKEDVWLDIATEEIKRTRSAGSLPDSPTPSKNMDAILDDFLGTVQRLYSDFFLLGKSPLDECSYEVCNVSPSVYASREYMDGHLSKTPVESRRALEQNLGLEDSFQENVNWGATGKARRLYCTPLLGRSSITWVCFLVDDHEFASLPTWYKSW